MSWPLFITDYRYIMFFLRFPDYNYYLGKPILDTLTALLKIKQTLEYCYFGQTFNGQKWRVKVPIIYVEVRVLWPAIFQGLPEFIPQFFGLISELLRGRLNFFTLAWVVWCEGRGHGLKDWSDPMVQNLGEIGGRDFVPSFHQHSLKVPGLQQV